MPIIVRPMRPEEGQTFLELHRRSVRGLAAKHYSPDVITAWAARSRDDAFLRTFLKNADDEIRLIAELDGIPVGYGALVVRRSELLACYVVPEAARKGVGAALAREIERIAKEKGLTRLELVSSINAEPFYAALGYEVVERTEHILGSGARMAAVKMEKTLS